MNELSERCKKELDRLHYNPRNEWALDPHRVAEVMTRLYDLGERPARGAMMAYLVGKKWPEHETAHWFEFTWRVALALQDQNPSPRRWWSVFRRRSRNTRR
jgi:hypothetical protein